jgi:hypothetical protein
MDHVSDAFIDNLLPLISLCEPAQSGDVKGVERVAPQFMQHAASMQKVCNFHLYIFITQCHAESGLIMGKINLLLLLIGC